MSAPAVALKSVVVAGAVGLGALSALGCVLAALFEVQGFGSRDGEPHTGYLIALALGFAASIVIPAFLWRWLFPRSGPGFIAAVGVAAAGVLLILGLSLRG